MCVTFSLQALHFLEICRWKNRTSLDDDISGSVSLQFGDTWCTHHYLSSGSLLQTAICNKLDLLWPWRWDRSRHEADFPPKQSQVEEKALVLIQRRFHCIKSLRKVNWLFLTGQFKSNFIWCLRLLKLIILINNVGEEIYCSSQEKINLFLYKYYFISFKQVTHECNK